MQRTIHQIWLQGQGAIPAEYLPLMESWRTVNPDCEYLLWDEASLDQLLSDRFPEYVGRWRELTPSVKKCDAARCLVLHEFGGIYADVDTQAFRSIDSLIHDLNLGEYDIVLSEESKSATSWKGQLTSSVAKDFPGLAIVSNAIMLSRRNVPFWRAFLEASFAMRDASVLESFSTWHLTRFLDQYTTGDKIAVIPASYLLAEVQTPSSYATHRYDGTWLDNSKPRPWEV